MILRIPLSHHDRLGILIHKKILDAVCFVEKAVVILGLAVTHFRRLSMEKESSAKRCCCIDYICKKIDDESACAKMGGRMVDSYTVCHY